MRHSFRLHSDSRALAVTRLEVEPCRAAPDILTLHYVVQGDIAALLIPQAAALARVDGLWQHTCFEAFIATGPGYVEFNFSPATEWAAYHFDGYRAGMRNADIAAPLIETERTPDRFALRARLALPRDATGPLALSAVIEEKGGNKSYWALAHPPGKADFHHADSFVLELPREAS